MRAEVFSTHAAFVRGAAAIVAELLQQAVAERGTASIALSGGDTPAPVYLALADQHGVPWEHIRFYWGDERLVPPDDDRSNFRLAWETLLAPLGIRDDHVMRVPTERGDEAAAAYDAQLRDRLGRTAAIDVQLLGIGADGHTASIFARSPALEERRHWAMTVDGPGNVRRVTMTMPAIRAARRMLVLAAGVKKADAVAAAMADDTDPRGIPAAALARDDGDPLFLLDASAASALPR